MSITRLPSTTKSLLSTAPLYPSFEATVSAVLTHLHPSSTSTLIKIHPPALRFTISTTCQTSPPTRLLTQLSTICSLELTTSHEKTHLRGGKTLSKGVGNGHQLVLDIWELFYSIPVRRRVEVSRSLDAVISATREVVIRVALAYPGQTLSLWSDHEIYSFGGYLNQDALQSAFGLSLQWLRVYKRDHRTTVDGFIAKEGSSNTRYQLAALSGTHDQRICDTVNAVWKTLPKGEHKRCAAFVINLTGEFCGESISSAVKGSLGVTTNHRQTTIEMPRRKKRSSIHRFEQAMIKRPRIARPMSEGRLSVKADIVKRPASAVEDAYRRMIPSWKNPCLPSRARTGLNRVYDKRSMCITKKRIGNVRIVGQVDNKFIVVSDEDGLYAVDQHAASERYLYETLLKKCLKERRPHRLANPKSVDIPVMLRPQKEKVLKNAEKWGWRLGDGLVVTHVPELPPLDAVIQADELVEWFEDCFRGHTEIPSVISRRVAMAACHAAVRFGDKLDKDMCSSIVTSLAECDMPFVCAHGRPNVVPIVAFDKT